MDITCITEFEQFLREQKGRIDERVSSDFSKTIINLMFEILFTELRIKFEDEDRKFEESVAKFDLRREMTPVEIEGRLE